jgi:hypothetical protein
MCAHLRAHSEAARPSSHAIRATSQPSNSLSQARSCSCNSATITDAVTTSKKGALSQSVGKDQHHDKGARLGKRRRGVRTHHTNGDAWLEEASILARRDGGLAVIMVGAPAIRTSAAICPTSHYRQWNMMSLKISSEGRKFLSQLTEGWKSKMSIQHFAICTTEENQSDDLKSTLGLIRGVLGILAFSPSKSCDAPLTMNGGRAHTTTTSVDLTRRDGKEGDPSCPR